MFSKYLLCAKKVWVLQGLLFTLPKVTLKCCGKFFNLQLANDSQNERVHFLKCFLWPEILWRIENSPYFWRYSFYFLCSQKLFFDSLNFVFLIYKQCLNLWSDTMCFGNAFSCSAIWWKKKEKLWETPSPLHFSIISQSLLQACWRK